MSHDDIKKIYEIILERWSGGRYRVAYNNVKFTPKANETYIIAFQKGSAILNQGLNGVYKKDESSIGELDNVIVDFIYDPL